MLSWPPCPRTTSTSTTVSTTLRRTCPCATAVSSERGQSGKFSLNWAEIRKVTHWKFDWHGNTCASMLNMRRVSQVSVNLVPMAHERLAMSPRASAGSSTRQHGRDTRLSHVGWHELRGVCAFGACACVWHAHFACSVRTEQRTELRTVTLDPTHESDTLGLISLYTKLSYISRAHFRPTSSGPSIC